MTSALSLCLGIFPLNLALNLVDYSGVVVGSWVIWGWLFGKDLVRQEKRDIHGNLYNAHSQSVWQGALGCKLPIYKSVSMYLRYTMTVEKS